MVGGLELCFNSLFLQRSEQLQGREKTQLIEVRAYIYKGVRWQVTTPDDGPHRLKSAIGPKQQRHGASDATTT